MSRNRRQQQSRESVSASSVSASSFDDSHVLSTGSKKKEHVSRSTFSGFWSDGELQEKEETGKKNKKGIIDYEGFYLTIGETIYEIGLGDVVALRMTEGLEENEDGNSQSRRRQFEEQERLLEEIARKEASSDYGMDATSEKASNYYQTAHEDITANEENLQKPSNLTESQDHSKATQRDVHSERPSIERSAPVKESDVTHQSMPELKVADGLMLARVERIWQEKRNQGRALFKARWFLKKEDVNSLPLQELTGPISVQEFADTVTEHDLVLSNQSDTNLVTTICDVVQVLYRNPKLDGEMPSFILPTTYLCRYSLNIEDTRVVVLPYSGEDDDWSAMTLAALTCKKRKAGQENDGGDKAASNRDRHDSDIGFGIESPMKRRRVGDFATTEETIDEGVIEQRDIQVGRNHQVKVPPFLPNQRIVSRNPICMWKPDKISQKRMDEYIEEASEILTPYLRINHLTQEEPYAPFPTECMESLSRSLKWKRLPTLSSVSTISSLTTNKVDALREVNLDSLLRNLHVSNYNIPAAIAVIKASPMDFVTAWSPHEKTRFDIGFRRYSGSLRAIFKGMGNKALREVIDYHYRFKIPDQFRRFQERKREQAVRMLECIETRRNLNAPIVVSNSIVGSSQTQSSNINKTSENSGAKGKATGDDKKDGAEWMTTSSVPLVISVEERRIKAKELLLDVETKFGRNTMVKVMEVLQSADEHALVECKTKLLEIFRGQHEFQRRFLEFLPQRLRL